MIIRRQHETTTIDELAGKACLTLQGVRPSQDGGFLFFYFRTEEAWYRFFSHYGILFWDTVPPDAEEDLDEGEDYESILSICGVEEGQCISTVNYSDGILTLLFENGQVLKITEKDNSGETFASIGTLADL